MKRRLMGESRCGDAALRYYLLTKKSAMGVLYGVQAELNGERTAVPGITLSRRRVQSLLDGLIRGQVTPVALRDVVDDWLLV